MNKENLIKTVRGDITNFLVHWTKDSDIVAFDVLKKIISEEKIKGNIKLVKGGFKVVCLTETPIFEMINFFNLDKIQTEIGTKYLPFGIGFYKPNVFRDGGRPVIYGDDNDYKELSEANKWRHVKFSPPDYDFTWEREWRIKSEFIEITKENCFIIVPTFKFADEIHKVFDTEWRVVTLSTLGLSLPYE
ncbi:MAG: hypothetical protein COB15_07795 [Flavobacteriales bacterium]|nr:MAG: hypothetical protein COB15_07795 [Flavobacteriales bacterium]